MQRNVNNFYGKRKFDGCIINKIIKVNKIIAGNRSYICGSL